MKKFIGFKMIQAKEITQNEWYTHKTGLPINKEYTKEEKDGYLVEYEGGYQSWSPKENIKKTYMQISEKNTITQENVDNFIKEIKIVTIGEKTTLVHATLENGFAITKTSACVDPENYDEKIGAEICMEHIKNEVWYLLGFLLQQRVHESKFVDVAGGC